MGLPFEFLNLVLAVETRFASSQSWRAASLHGFLHASRWFGRGLGAGYAGAMDFDVRDLDRLDRTFAVRGHASDFLNQLDRGIVALTENGIAAGQMFTVGNVLSDEELGAVGVGARVGVGETPGTVELDVGRSLILEFVAGIAGAVPGGISTLNHEFGNHPVKDGAVIKGDTVLLGVRDGAGPVFGAVSKADEIFDPDRSYLRQQRAMEVAGRGVDDGGGLRGSSGGFVRGRS